jgi:glycosyltransferase involved in cell wall biosynthesis
MTISIIIPTYNEEKYLLFLLESIKKQNVEIKEIIVADGFSKDKTREIAKDQGCIVVDGPDHPGVGRNRGAKIAKGDLLLFIDADVILPDGFLERYLLMYKKSKAICGTCIYRASNKGLIDYVSFCFGGLITYIMQFLSPLAAGYFIAINRDVFEKLNGFDENLKLAEDHDLAKRASKIGKFKVFWLTITTSSRRFKAQGQLKISLLYVWITILTICGVKIKRDNKFFKYDFGKFD